MKSLCDEICLRQMKSKLRLDEIKSTQPTDKVDFIPQSLKAIKKNQGKALYIINFVEIVYHQHGVLYLIIAIFNTAYG